MADVNLEAGISATRVFYLLDADGRVVDLTSTTARAALASGATRITETATVTGATAGEVTHVFNVATAGEYTLRLLITNGQGVTTRYPDGAPLTLTVWERT